MAKVEDIKTYAVTTDTCELCGDITDLYAMPDLMCLKCLNKMARAIEKLIASSVESKPDKSI